MWGGAHVQLTTPPPGQAGLGGRPVPQVGSERRNGSGWDYFTEDELRAAGNLGPRFETEWQPGVKKVVALSEEAPSEAMHKRLVALMREHGEPVKGEALDRGISREGVGEMNVAWTFDAVLARPVAKIAVNYLARTQGAEFARRPEFEDIRHFVREGMRRPPTTCGPSPARRRAWLRWGAAGVPHRGAVLESPQGSPAALPAHTVQPARLPRAAMHGVLRAAMARSEERPQIPPHHPRVSRTSPHPDLATRGLGLLDRDLQARIGWRSVPAAASWSRTYFTPLKAPWLTLDDLTVDQLIRNPFAVAFAGP